MQCASNRCSSSQQPIARLQASSCQLTSLPVTTRTRQHRIARSTAGPRQQAVQRVQLQHSCSTTHCSGLVPKLRLVATHVAAATHEQSAAEESPLPSSSSHPEAADIEELNTPTSSSSVESSSSSTDSSSSSSEESSDENTASTSAGPDVQVQVLSDTRQLDAVAKLRAEAYYEHDRSRFAASFKKQFAAQEAESLRQRTAPTTSSQRPQLCDCLVAVDAAGVVVGCIDIRLPESYTQMKTIGVPDDEAAGCYLLNVVVAEEHRGCGVGKTLMRAAMSRAVGHWGAQRLYTHVEADNEVANRLYRSCGFEEHSSESKYANTSSLGRLVLLMATVDAVDAAQQ